MLRQFMLRAAAAAAAQHPGGGSACRRGVGAALTAHAERAYSPEVMYLSCSLLWRLGHNAAVCPRAAVHVRNCLTTPLAPPANCHPANMCSRQTMATVGLQSPSRART